MPLVNRKGKITLAALVLGIVFIAAIATLKPAPERAKRPPPPLLMVDVITAAPQHLRPQVLSQGTVAPKREIDLISQVSGKVIAVADDYGNGSFFRSGDQLIQIESDEYQFAVVRAKAQLAKALEQVALEKGRSRQAKREWRDLGDRTANALFLREPQLAAAEATLESARADLDKANLDLSRTQIVTPFQGRIRQTFVDLGQFVGPGARIAKIYSTDVVEVRLPLSDRQVSLIDLPVNFEDAATANYPNVTLRSTVGDRHYEWNGKIVRTESSIDIQSRMTYAVAEIQNPFKEDPNSDRPPLSIGMFVEAEIEGRSIANAVPLPKQIIYRGDEILVLNANNEIAMQKLTIVQSDGDSVVAVDIPSGTRVVGTRIGLPVPGMKVTTSENLATTTNLAEGEAQ
ncbi:MAG: efflux RND transporter periplasmic adaptor subunit [Porticoccaceae bacterium]|nr:efflux RND transporter periplasmic adaptor subunit [Porticoccaceae bacterium]